MTIMLWLALHLPHLPLEANAPLPSPSAVVERGRILLGDEVARRAGMPGGVVQHARHALAALESRATASQAQVDLFAPPPVVEAVTVSAVESSLAGIDPDVLSPREALDLLYQLKKLSTHG